MAEYIQELKGNYEEFVQYVEESVMSKSMTVLLESKRKTILNDVKCTVMSFERYSYTGGNRVSMCVTILGYNQDIRLIANAAGGSQAKFFKINTWGEESFLETLIQPVEAYIQKG
ncbi:MAG: DUF6054 family protein [Longibaculum sp.]